MGKGREYNRIHSTIDDLPEDTRQILDHQLANPRMTYNDISLKLKDMGFEISRSAIGRYALNFNKAAMRIKAAKEQTSALIAQIKDHQNIEATEAASAILIDALTRRIATAEEDFDSIPVDKAGRLLVQLQRSEVYKERYQKERARACRDVEKNLLRRLRQQIREAPELLSQISAMVTAAANEEALKDAPE